jgi:hypothetical protein
VWFGYSLSLAIVVLPAISSLPITTQRQFGAALAKHGTPIITALVPVIVVLGFIRGTFLGPIKSVTDVFNTTYGITWLVALVEAIATYGWGRLVIVPSIDALNAAPQTAEGRSNAGVRSRPGARQAGHRAGAAGLRRHLHLHDPHAVRALTV